MSVFDAVKQSVTTRQAAESYGIKILRNGMACCIFHEDRTSSMKVDGRFHCFGCGAEGDVIDFAAQLFGLGVKHAGEKLAADFGIQYDNKSHFQPVSIKRKLTEKQQLQKAINDCYEVLCDYLHLMENWKKIYAPESENENWHPLFVEALQKTEYVKYLLDILWGGTMEEKKQLVKDLEKEIPELKRKTEKYKEKNNGKEEKHHGYEREIA